MNIFLNLQANLTKQIKMRRVIQLVLLAVIVFLSYLIIVGVQRPIEFNKEKEKRYKKIIEKLILIRDAEMAYKSVKGKYAGDWDSLVIVMKTDSFPMVKKTGYVPEHLTEKQAIDSGYAKRDTFRVSMIDSLFKKFSPDSIKYVPFTDAAIFELAAKQLETGSKVVVPVLEVKVHNDVILKGMDDQLRINLNADRRRLDKYPGLKIGSLEEASTSGNWESL